MTTECKDAIPKDTAYLSFNDIGSMAAFANVGLELWEMGAITEHPKKFLEEGREVSELIQIGYDASKKQSINLGMEYDALAAVEPFLGRYTYVLAQAPKVTMMLAEAQSADYKQPLKEEDAKLAHDFFQTIAELYIKLASIQECARIHRVAIA